MNTWCGINGTYKDVHECKLNVALCECGKTTNIVQSRPWTRHTSDQEWWSHRGFEAHKIGEKWELHRDGALIFRDEYLQTVIAHAHSLLASEQPKAHPEAVQSKVEQIKALVAYHGHVSPAFAKKFYAIVDGDAPEAAQAEPMWRCFHCDETFTDSDAAAEHFGKSEYQQPGCQIDIAEYRKMEEVNRRYCEEDTDLHRQIHGLTADHLTALRREEEKGYARGLRDAKAEPAEDAARGLSCDGCREWIAANSRGGWIENLRNKAEALEIRLAKAERKSAAAGEQQP